MVTKTMETKSQTAEAQNRNNAVKGRQERLDRELEDTFPASDPPTVTLPGVKPGAPEREGSGWKYRARCD
jgi:hypothetical protein